ncbi:ATP12 family protein [Novosphingobium sp.]|uniref:ATP12 family protein n=1 Tax=Novosphingobium sp. TaxID=1874826 RepID=UPI00286AA9EC|nr:ATP12 family protein [Novosphingobium sp.]
MRRFWKEATVAAVDGGWQVALDGRGVKTQGGNLQVVPAKALAEALAAEWAAQGDPINPAQLVLRDLADFAIDVVAPDRPAALETLLRYAETDTLCYRADPDDALHARQQELWEPLLAAAEARWDIRFLRISGVLHQPLPAPTLARLCRALDAENDFTLSALTTMASLAASLVVALTTLQDGADANALWTAAELEEDWQAELWGKDYEAEERRARRFAAFRAAMGFAGLVRG